MKLWRVLQTGACLMAAFSPAGVGATPAAPDRPPPRGLDVVPHADAIAAPRNVTVSSPDGKTVTVSWEWAPEPCGASSARCAQVKESFFEVWADPRYPGTDGPRMLLRGSAGGPMFSGKLSAPADASVKQCYLVVAKAKYGKVAPLLGNAELPYDVRHLSTPACIVLGVKTVPFRKPVPQVTPTR
jgi:hypothetical protein